MPTITPSGSPAHAGLQPFDPPPGWDALPPELHLQICRSVGLADLGHLRLVSHATRDLVATRVLELRRLDDACRAWLERADAGAVGSEPPHIDAAFAGEARALERAGLAGMAVVLNLQQMRDAMRAGFDFPMTCEAFTIPGLMDGSVTGCVRDASGEPEFIADVGDMASERRRIAFCSRDGTIRLPDALQGTVLAQCDQVEGSTVHYGTGCDGDGILVVQDEAGRLGLYFRERDAYQPLPDRFTDEPLGYRPQAAVSPNGRYVAALLENGLLVHDIETGAPVAEAQPGVIGTGLSLDSHGNPFVGRLPDGVGVLDADILRRMFDAGYYLGGTYDRDARAWQALPGEQGVNAGWLTLSPDERYFVKGFGDDGIVLEDRQAPESQGIELRRSSGDSRLGPTGAALSRGGVAMAVAYADLSLALFDLAAAAGQPFIEPKVTLYLPITAGGAGPSLFFSHDGSRLDVVYRTEHGAEFVRYALA